MLERILRTLMNDVVTADGILIVLAIKVNAVVLGIFLSYNNLSN